MGVQLPRIMKIQLIPSAAAAVALPLSACGTSTPADEADEMDRAEATPYEAGANDADQQVSEQADSSDITPAAAGGASVAVPLTAGVYVLKGTSCETPANAAWRMWDGDGLLGSSTRNCRATVISQSGKDYRLRNSCENTYDGTRTDEDLLMTVTDQVHFSVKGQAFDPCSTAQLPKELSGLLNQ